jgi:hypothetical protein
MLKHLMSMTAVFAVLSVFGCGGPHREALIDVPEEGLTMRAPSGWRVYGGDAALICSKGDNTGVMIIEPLEGKAFSEYVRQLAAQFGGKVISETTAPVNGCEAVRTVVEYPMQGSKSMSIYIHKGDKLINISFTTLIEDFPKYESSLKDSLASIRFK